MKSVRGQGLALLIIVMLISPSIIFAASNNQVISASKESAVLLEDDTIEFIINANSYKSIDKVYFEVYDYLSKKTIKKEEIDIKGYTDIIPVNINVSSLKELTKEGAILKVMLCINYTDDKGKMGVLKENYFYSYKNDTLNTSVSSSKASGLIEGEDVISYLATSSLDKGILKASYSVYSKESGLIYTGPIYASKSKNGDIAIEMIFNASEIKEKVKPGDNIEVRTDVSWNDNGKIMNIHPVYKYVFERESNMELNNNLEGLAIELYADKSTNFYEASDKIPFTLYYYNPLKEYKEDVEIHVEVPDGMQVDNAGDFKTSGKKLVYETDCINMEELKGLKFTLSVKDEKYFENGIKINAEITSKKVKENTTFARVFIYKVGETATHNAYVNGYLDGTFRPDNYITREEVAALLVRGLEIKTISLKQTFSDVPKTNWAYDYINTCQKNGILTGYENGMFMPKNNITMAELYATVYRAIEPESTGNSIFIDKSYNTDFWAKDYMAGLERLGMLKQLPDTNPDKLATRAETVHILNKLLFRNPSSSIKSDFRDASGHWAEKDIAEASKSHSYNRVAGGIGEYK